MLRRLLWAVPALVVVLAVSCGETLDHANRGAGGAAGAAGAAGKAGAAGAGGAGAGGTAGAGPITEPPEPSADDWRRKTLYLALADRFFDGNPANNALGIAGCYDPNAPLRHHGGDLAGFVAKLDYLRSLGVGALWSTPLYRQAGPQGDQCGYHGYWADYRDPYVLEQEIEPKLGTQAEFDALLAALHGAGIAFVLDMVVNHAGRGATIVGQHPDWFNPDGGPACAKPKDEVLCPLSGLPDFDQRRADVAAYLNAASAPWLTRFAVDGIRLDTAKHVDPGYLSGGWVPTVRATERDEKPLFLLAEVFDESGPEAYRRFLDGGFDATFDFALRAALRRSFALGESTDALAAAVAATQTAFGPERAGRLVTFLDNHDVPRFLSEVTAGLTPDERLRRFHLALAALFTLPGTPQLYAGDELGAEGTYPENRRSMPPWAFDAEGRAGTHPGYVGDSQKTFAYVQKLVALHSANPALFAGAYAELWRPNGAADLYAFFRGWARRSIVVVVNNANAATGPIALPFRANPGLAPNDRDALPDGTELVDLLGEGAPASLRVENGAIAVTLPPKTVGVYRATP